MKTILSVSFILLIISAIFISGKEEILSSNNINQDSVKTETEKERMLKKLNKSEKEWKKELSTEQYCVMFEKGTERAFTGKYYDHHEEGIYTCAACNSYLFSSDSKYDSGSGWPSYFQPFSKESINYNKDSSYGMVRTEVVCAKCEGHLGHVFTDGSEPTGLRYCINSISMNFIPKDKLPK